MRTAHQRRVDEFMRLAGQDVPDDVVDEPSEDCRILRAKLIHEKCLETIAKGLGVQIVAGSYTVITSPKCKFEYSIGEFSSGKFDLVEVIDGCADIKVVTTGTLSALGIDDEPIQEEVDYNNLSKFGPGGYRAEGEDSKEKPGPAGKWMKPPGHEPPDITGVIEKMRREQIGKSCDIADPSNYADDPRKPNLDMPPIILSDIPLEKPKMGGPENSFQKQIDQYEKSKPKTMPKKSKPKTMTKNGWDVPSNSEHPEYLVLEIHFNLDDNEELLLLRDIKKLVFHKKEKFPGLYDSLEQKMITYTESLPPLKNTQTNVPGAH